MTAFRRLCGRFIPPASALLSVGSYVVVGILLVRGRGIFGPEGAEAAAIGGGIFSSADVAIGTAMLGTFAMVLVAGAILLTYLFLPGFLTGLLAFPVALTWRRPMRILVLRRFGTPAATQHLQRVLRREVAPYGHVYTLADKDIDVPWYIRIPVVFTQLVFLHFRERRLKSAKAIDRLQMAMRITWARNVNWVVSRWKTFPLRCADAHWRQAVSMAANEVDAIIVDVSEPTENLAWEIRRCQESGSIAKVLFVCRQACVERAREFLGQQGVSQKEDQRLFILDDDDDVTRLGSQLHRQSSDAKPDRRSTFTGHLRAATLMAGPFVWAGILVAGITAIGSAGENQKDDTAVSLFAELTDRARDPATRDQALAELSRRIEETTSVRPSPEWVSHFDATVLPLYRRLWAEEPHRRRRILTDLQRSASKKGDGIWRQVLDQGAAADPKDIELTITGIFGARSRANVPDLVDYLGAAPHFRKTILGLLVYLDDPRSVPGLIRLAGREDAEWTALGPQIREVLRSILVGDAAVHPRKDARELEERFVALMLGDPERARTRLLERVRARLGQTGAAGVSQRTKLYGDVEVRLEAAGFAINSRPNVVFNFPGAADFAKGSLEYAGFFDAAILVVDAGHGLTPVTAEHIELAADLGIPRMLVYIDTAGRAAGPATLQQLATIVVSLLERSGFDEAHRSLIADTPVSAASGEEELSEIEAILGQLSLWPQRPATDREAVRFAVSASFNIDGRGTVALGFLESGNLVPGQRLQVVGHRSRADVVFKERYDGHGLDFVEGIVVQAPPGIGLVPGQVLATIGSVREYERFRARLSFLSEAEGGPESLVSILAGQGLLQRDRSLSLTFRATEAYPNNFDITLDSAIVLNEQTVSAEISLFEPIALEVGQRFRLRDGDGKLAGAGVVTGLGH